MEATTAAAAAAKVEPAKPYSWWWHPHKTFLDIFLGFLASLVLPIKPFKYNEDSDESLYQEQLLYAQKIRASLTKMFEHHGGFKVWAKNIGKDICMAKNATIPRNDNIFKDWGISNKKHDIPGNSDIEIQLAFPVTILPDHVAVPETKNGYGCFEIDKPSILELLPKHVPVVIFFAGGGLTIGSHLASEAIDLLNASKTDERFIYMSVKYSQAPDAPFPAAVCECLSVTDWILQRFDNVHLCGVSGGGNLSLVAGLEACRANKHRNLKSIVSLIPMLDPSTSSRSYIENSTSSHFLPPYLLHWSYQVYLGLPDLGQKDNKQAWEQSKWRSSELRRLAEPLHDVPNISNQPKIVIMTNAADPLHDDGLSMVKKLREQDNEIQYFDVKGSHWLGLLFDRSAYQKLADTWKETIFGDAK